MSRRQFRKQNLSVNGPMAVEIEVIHGLTAVSVFSGNAAVEIEIWLCENNNCCMYTNVNVANNSIVLPGYSNV